MIDIWYLYDIYPIVYDYFTVILLIYNTFILLWFINKYEFYFNAYTVILHKILSNYIILFYSTFLLVVNGLELEVVPVGSIPANNYKPLNKINNRER